MYTTEYLNPLEVGFKPTLDEQNVYFQRSIVWAQQPNLMLSIPAGK